MAEIRKRHDGAAAHPQHLPKHLTRPVSLLERLAEDDVIEGRVGVIGESLVEIALEDRDAAGDGALDFGAGELDAARIDALIGGEPFEQLAFAAAEVEHAAAGLDDLADDRVIAATQQIPDKPRLHESFSNVVERNPRTRSVCSATSTRKASWP